jgi:hypothetical protein
VDIAEKIESRRKHLEEIESTFQPVLLFVGPTTDGSISSYVVLDSDIRYNCSSVFDAIDTTFKLIFALDVKYPRESEQIFLFLQQILYDIDENCKQSTVSVNQLLSIVRAA